MPMSPCRVCQKDVSDDAKACPHCGAGEPSESPRAIAWRWISLIFWILVCIGGFGMVREWIRMSREEEVAADPGRELEVVAATEDGFVMRVKGEERKLSLYDFNQALRKAGLEVGDQETMFAQVIGAADGCRLDVNGQTVEAYEFALDADGRAALDKISRDGVLGFEVLTNANLVLVPDYRHSRWRDIHGVFESL
jgi:hypothetical protein